MDKYRCLVATIVVMLLCIDDIQSSRNPINLIDNGYETILIAIHESVPEDHRIVDRLKEIFTDASGFVFQGTFNRTYYRNVTILLPNTWSDELREAPATTERFDIANVIVDQPNPNYGDNPYTKQTKSCGELGDYIHLTERWLVDEDYSWYYWGNPGKVIGHEWAHLRWGVFDEYPTEEYEHFYYDENGHVQPSRCSEAVTGVSLDIYDGYKECNKDPSSGVLPDSGCRFFPKLENNEATGSYMYANYLDSVFTYCHSSDDLDQMARHNRLARNKQNKQCCYDSAWDVMLDSDDFAKEANPPRDILPDTFILVVQEVELRIVLVLDVSGSMDDNNRLDLLLQASTRYIGYTVPNATWIGIVEFSNDATILSELVQIVGVETRKELIEELPDDAKGATSIGSGLLAGLSVLERGPGGAAGGIIFLISDGEENTPPYMKDVVDLLVQEEVVVDTLALSDEADEGLAKLSDATGGTAYWYSESDESTALHDAFTDTITSRTSTSTDTPVQLASYKTDVEGRDGIFKEEIYIDQSIGRHTIFFIFWEFGSDPVEVVVRDPSGNIIDNQSGTYVQNDDTNTIIIQIEGIAQVLTEDPVPFREFGRVTSGGLFQVDSGVYIPGDDEDLIPPE
uniref:Calcium-activated chloride channel regulator 1-like n=1 Tax=Saccoglossus kowalevskii TaxID=10224 RepID=A0ABM0MR23_SACKO|nr:PREDICTED: calcium-activated chloride channel regulator 1-like [Saccoglossus kowalevskii]